MAWTLADLDKLKRARATGARRVKYEDREVLYHSMEEMLALQREMEAELGLLNPQAITQVRIAWDRGHQ